MRLLILIVTIALLVFIVKALFHKPAAVKRRPQNKLGEKVVPCAVCELHLPTSEAFQEGQRYFCSREHRQQWLDSASPANDRQ